MGSTGPALVRETKSAPSVAKRSERPARAHVPERAGGAEAATLPSWRVLVSPDHVAPRNDAARAEALRGVSGPGVPLADAVRSPQEQRFGRDLSDVRVHTDSAAAAGAQAISARAYTVGADIGFAEGAFAPATHQGHELLAHELGHVVQEEPGIRRCPDTTSEKDYDTRADRIRKHPVYLNLDADPRRWADEILAGAKGRDDCIALMDKLELLFDTPEADPAVVSARGRARTEEGAADAEAKRKVRPRRATRREERIASFRKSFKTVTTASGKYEVDSSDVYNIVVRAKVHLKASGTGTAADVKRIENMEAAIEWISDQPGYFVDLEFVNEDEVDATTFEVLVDPSQHPTAEVWGSGSAHTFAHELHHLLGLDDRYDYTEHADNDALSVVDRVAAFRYQLDVPAGFEDNSSLMGVGRDLSAEDICKIADLDPVMCRVTRPLLDAVLPLSPELPLTEGRTSVDLLAATMVFWIDTKYAENKNLAMALLRVQVLKATNSRAVSEALLAVAKDDTHDLHRALSVLDKGHRKELLAIISP